MNKDTIKYILRDFHEKSLPEACDRSTELPLDIDKIITLIGIRRSGKTYLLYRTMRRLIDDGIDKHNIIYINFEDDRLFPVTLSEMDLILKAYHELYPDKLSEKKYLFLDEIQQAPGWEKYIRRVYDTESVRIYLTGSSSEIASRTLSTSLRGRTIPYEVFPLSFREYLHFTGIEIKEFSPSAEARILHALRDYLDWGGFPEVVKTDNKRLRWKILHEYADLILYKDLIEQYGIKNQYLLKYLLKHFMTNTSTMMSINKLYNDLKSQGLSLSKDSLYEYIEYLREAYILFYTDKHSRSVRVQKQNPSKHYIIDTGLMQVFQPDPDRDLGKKLENAVYLYLRRNEEIKEIYYYKNHCEIDFYYFAGSTHHLANVAYVVHDMDTAKREVNGLLQGKKVFPEACGSLILNDWNPELIPDDVTVIPAWKFLVEGNGIEERG